MSDAGDDVALAVPWDQNLLVIMTRGATIRRLSEKRRQSQTATEETGGGDRGDHERLVHRSDELSCVQSE